jgi:hypothetical protein
MWLFASATTAIAIGMVEVAVYSGSGSTDDAADFSCRVPDR